MSASTAMSCLVCGNFFVCFIYEDFVFHALPILPTLSRFLSLSWFLVRVVEQPNPHASPIPSREHSPSFPFLSATTILVNHLSLSRSPIAPSEWRSCAIEHPPTPNLLLPCLTSIECLRTWPWSHAPASTSRLPASAPLAHHQSLASDHVVLPHHLLLLPC